MTEAEIAHLNREVKAEVLPSSNGNGLAVVERQPAALTPVQLLQMALAQGADIDKLKQLMDLQERWEKNEARKAFVAAMRKFKEHPPDIHKNKSVKFGNTAYSHATLDHVCDEVTKGLSAVGITHTWKVSQPGEVITVSCVLTHELGHSEETQLTGAPDNSGSKNSIQAIGSTVTYLQRYTLLAACGLAAGNDDDGNNSGKPTVDAKEVEKNCAEMKAAKDAPSLKFLFTVALDKAREVGDKKAMAEYIAVNDARKKELGYANR